jgi:two-component system, cell cycle response regulator DivK
MATVLIADDDENTRLLVQTLLSHAGHRVFQAQNGLQALDVAFAHTPDLILLDLSMPGMSGAELLRALRSDSRTKTATVALYTATPMNAAMRDFMEMYAIREAIPKPSEPAHFMAAVERALASA